MADSDTSADPGGRRAPWPAVLLMVAAAVALGALIRIPALAGSDFPLNDGGLFAVMIEDIQANGFRLPVTSTYNQADIPFSYPPAPLYLAAILNAVFGVSIPALLRILPLLASLATVVAACWLAWQLAPTRTAAALSCLLFPLLPYGYEWMIMGAGLTRSCGLLFATLGAAASHRLLVRREPRLIVPCVVFASLAVLSHPEMAAFMALTMALFWAVLGRDVWGAGRAALVAGLVALVTSPWWALVLMRHGLSPFLGAADTAGSWLPSAMAFLSFSVTGELHFTPLAVLALVGLFLELSRRRHLLPLWTCASLLVPRAGGFEVASLPLAVLAGIGLGCVVERGLSAVDQGLEPSTTAAPLRQRLLRTALLVYIIAVALTASWARLASPRHQSLFLSTDERVAMEWIKNQTDPNSRFVVVTSSESWAEDPVAEWFPALADRVSITTPQGFEWRPAGEWRRREALYDRLKLCAESDLGCLEGWGAAFGESWSHVAISKPARGRYVPQRLASSLAASPGYQMLFDNDGMVVFARRQSLR